MLSGVYCDIQKNIKNKNSVFKKNTEFFVYIKNLKKNLDTKHIFIYNTKCKQQFVKQKFKERSGYI